MSERNNDSRRPLMGTSNILGKQNNGYKHTAWAIAEIVDNSIQAGATNIQVCFIGMPNQNNKLKEILIIDDGSGMKASTFSLALQFGSGERSGATRGLGKYGQGLPNSSVSQTKRVEVFTSTGDEYLFNYLDLDEIHESQEPYLPEITSKNPSECEHISQLTSLQVEIPEKGTIVRWANMNRARPANVNSSVKQTEAILGRVFRYYIKGFTDTSGQPQKCRINIKCFDYNGTMYTANNFYTIGNIQAFDPMFLLKNVQGSSQFPNIKPPYNKVHAPETSRTFTLPSGDQATVELNFSYCPRENREIFGRNAGSTEFGKLYHKRNLPVARYNPVSIVRAGREIDSGVYGFITDVSNPKNRWWSVEIKFEAILDDILGVDYTKQSAENIRLIDSASGELEDNEIATWISNTVFENIKTLRDLSEKKPVNIPDDDDGIEDLPDDIDHEPGEEPGGGNQEDLEQAKTEFKDWVKARYPNLTEGRVNGIVNHALQLSDHHLFVPTDLGDSDLYSYKVIGTKVLIEINVNHPFYKHYFNEIENANNELLQRSTRLLIGAMVSANISRPTDNTQVVRDRRDTKIKFAQRLADYIEDLYRS